MQSNSNLLALDVGGRRIGVAIASHIAKLPRPYSTIEQSENIFNEINEIITSEDVDTIVIGYPRNLEGQSTQQTAIIEDFARELKSHTSVPLVFQDEALTSRYAEEELESRGKAYKKSDIDALAATYILQDYLDENFRS